MADASAAGLLCGPRDSCDTGVGAVMLPVETGAAGFLRCRSERTPEGACVTVCGVGFSALPFCAGSGRCEARCSAERAASGRVVECGDAPASRLGNGAAGDIGFSAPPFCAGIGRCEARCSAGRAASGRVVERNFAVGRRRCGSRMLPSCGATIHAGSAGRLRRAAGLLRRNMILLRDLGGAIRRNARRLLHRLGIASADGRALRSCRTGRWRILRAARLLRPRTSSCGIADQCRTGDICRMGSWLFSCRTVWCRCWLHTDMRRRRVSCHTGSRRGRRRRMFCCWLRTCRVRSLHKGIALLRGFCMRRLHLTFSCAADRLCRAARSGRRRCRSVWRCIGRGCIRCAPLCVRRLHKGAALLCGFGLYRLSLCAAAVIRLSCTAGRLIGTARRILACRFSCRAGQNSPAAILHCCAAARMGFRLRMCGLLLLRILCDRAAHGGLRSIRTMIRRIGRCFSCRGCCIVLWRRHMTRRTSCAGRHSCFPRGVRLLAISGRRGLRECARHLFCGRLYSIRLCRRSLRGNRFLTGCRTCAALLRRRAMMIAVCIRGRVDIGRIAAASAWASRCAWLGFPAAAARLMAIFADGMRCIGQQ